MRTLLKSINELFDAKPTKPTKETEEGHLKTGHITYMSMKNAEEKHKYHPDYSGTTHDVGWNTEKREGTKQEKTDMLHDALHTHRHFIQHKTNVGDVVINTPDKSVGGSDKRARIYKKAAGFGAAATENDDNANIQQRVQHGIVRQYPEDHPDEDKRGKKYLHPLNHDDITAHENPKPDKPDKPARIIKWS